MNAVDFIIKDIQKSKIGPMSQCLLAITLFFSSLGLGFFLRDDNGNGLQMSSMVSALIGYALLLVTLKKIQQHKLSVLLVFMIFILSAFTAFTDTRTIYSSSEIFWHEGFRCFTKGVISTSLTGIALSFFAFTVSSWPNRTQRLALSYVSGLSGALMLEIHCDSSSWGHLLFGHHSQGLLAGIFIFVLLESLFIWKIRGSIPSIRKMRNINRLG